MVWFFKGNSGAGKHAGVIAQGVTTSLGAEIASLPSQFRGKFSNSRKKFLWKSKFWDSGNTHTQHTPSSGILLDKPSERFLCTMFDNL